MSSRPGDVVLIPFPYSDLESSKKRPVLVLTAPDRNGDFIALAITSAQVHDHAVEIGAASLTVGTLPRRGWVRLDKIFTLSADGILKTFGAVTASSLRDVLDGMCRRVGYSNP
jgi:mRNA interferase MazF